MKKYIFPIVGFNMTCEKFEICDEVKDAEIVLSDSLKQIMDRDNGKHLIHTVDSLIPYNVNSFLVVMNNDEEAALSRAKDIISTLSVIIFIKTYGKEKYDDIKQVYYKRIESLFDRRMKNDLIFNQSDYGFGLHATNITHRRIRDVSIFLNQELLDEIFSTEYSKILIASAGVSQSGMNARIKKVINNIYKGLLADDCGERILRVYSTMEMLFAYENERSNSIKNRVRSLESFSDFDINKLCDLRNAYVHKDKVIDDVHFSHDALVFGINLLSVYLKLYPFFQC